MVAIRKHAAASGLTVVEVFREEAVPGATEWDDRPAWVAMLEKIVGNGVRTIVIERLDRVARDLMVQEHIIADLRKRGVELVSTEEPDLGSTEPSRVAMRQMMGVFAQYEKAMIVLKLRGARQRKKAADGRCEGRKPYGFYPGEAQVLAAMRRLSESGTKPAIIARLLNDKGMRPRGGSEWHPYAVSRILRRVA